MKNQVLALFAAVLLSSEWIQFANALRERHNPPITRDTSGQDVTSQSRDSSAAEEEGEREPRALNWGRANRGHLKHVLPVNKQVSAFLPGGRPKRFLYTQRRENSPISLVVTPCSAHLAGYITFYPVKIREGGRDSLVVLRVSGPDQILYTERRGEPGSYDINITALSDTYVHFFVANEDLAGLSALQASVEVRSRPQGRAEVSWLPATFSGQSLSYCLIAAPDTRYNTVCGALGAKFGLRPPSGAEVRRRREQAALRSLRRRAPAGDPNIVVGCVGRYTTYELHELTAGQRYKVALFGQYNSVSFPYGVADFTYGTEPRRWLTVRRAAVTRLRLTPSRPRRRLLLRPSRRAARTGAGLHYYVTSCGGPLRLRVFRGRRQPAQIQAADVSAVGLFAGQINRTSEWYQFVLDATGGATKVELQATWRRKKLRLAQLPNKPTVKSASKRRYRKLGLGCGQLAITMQRSRGRRLHYCVLLDEDHSGRRGRVFKPPSVCGLDTRLELTPRNYTVCGDSKQLRRGKRIEVVFSDLPGGQRYVVRAMVKPEGGRFLPYHLSQVMVPRCPTSSGGVWNSTSQESDDDSNVIVISTESPSAELDQRTWSELVNQTLAETREESLNALGLK